MKKIVFLLLLACVVQSFAKSCKKASDCEEGECCVNHAVVSVFGGRCERLRNKGENCTPLLKDDGSIPDMYHFVCPCVSGFECEAENEIRIGDIVGKYKPKCVAPGSK